MTVHQCTRAEMNSKQDGVLFFLALGGLRV